MEPIGIGTPDVESLTSYITRLAEAHSVKVGTLITKEIMPLLKEKYNYTFLKKFDSDIKISKEMVRVIEELTLIKNLKFLTMQTWSIVFPQNKLCSNQSWCPICFEEQKRKNQQIYKPLIWSLISVKICLKHRTALNKKCSYCKKLVPQLAPNSRNGYCSNCNSWLGNDNCIIENIDEHVNYINGIGKLLSNVDNISTKSSYIFCKTNISCIINELPLC